MDRCNHCQQELVGIDIRRERQQDGINKAKADGVRFGPKPLLTAEVVKKIKELRVDGLTVAEIMRRMKLSKASIYRALASGDLNAPFPTNAETGTPHELHCRFGQ
jgi:DNA invertase Pin-like site-specific DNA recombinase